MPYEDAEELPADISASNQPHPHLVVGLGASAGGIEALRALFSKIPSDSGLAYVVILHLSPDYESRLAEVLQKTATIPVLQVHDPVPLEPDHAYVISANQKLEVRDGMLVPSEPTRIEERKAPVDVFFRTLAAAYRDAAVAVVLSGTGPNGSNGLKRVKEFGGLAIVQDPTEAAFDEMPKNSLATGNT
jgi:two-component system, chemotaxis family, CheB/CheR fusion protein